MISIRTLVLTFAVAAGLHVGCASALATPLQIVRETPPAGMGRYIVVLIEPDLIPPSHRNPDDRHKIEEPDFAKLGGRVLSREGNRRTIDLPPAAAKAVRAHESVAFMQRVWTGESLENWDEPEESDGGANARFQPRTDSETDLTWATGQFAYDGSGNIHRMGNDSYTYDSAGRLISAVVNGVSETYKYDSFGNLIEKSSGRVGTLPIDPSTNRISGAEYDAAGALLDMGDAARRLAGRSYKSWYTYDSLGMMTSVNGSIAPKRMIYTADDERIAVEIDEVIDWSIRDFEGRVIRAFRGREWMWSADYIYSEGKTVARERNEFYGGKVHFHLDHLGNTRMVTRADRKDRGRHDFYPFGVERTLSVQEIVNFPIDSSYWRNEPKKFTGHERDFIGLANVENTDYLDYMHARFYEPNLGRFLSVDPFMDYEVAIKNPQGWNRYAYVRNNPMSRTDPTGKCEDPGGPGTRICIGTFIPKKTFGGFQGDNRGPNPTGGMFRTQQTINISKPSLMGVLAEKFKPGISVVGSKARQAEVAKQEVSPSSNGVVAKAESSDGLLYGAAPNLEYNLTLKPTGDGGLKVTGTHTAFPSLEVWRYEDGKTPQLLYHHDASGSGFVRGLIGINRTVEIPDDDH